MSRITILSDEKLIILFSKRCRADTPSEDPLAFPSETNNIFYDFGFGEDHTG